MLKIGRIWVSLVVFLMIAAHISGCASVYKDLPNILIADSHFFRTNAEFAAEHAFTSVDYAPAQAPAMLRLASGRHTIRTSVVWSNGYKEATEFTFDVIEDERYVFYALERNAKQDPSDIVVRSKTSEEKSSEELTEAFHWGFLGPFLFPFLFTREVFKAVQNSEHQPTGRPGERCCFVWVGEGKTNRVVAGQRPSDMQR